MRVFSAPYTRNRTGRHYTIVIECVYGRNGGAENDGHENAGHEIDGIKMDGWMEDKWSSILALFDGVGRLT